MNWEPLEREQNQPKKLDALLDSLLHKLSGSSPQAITTIINKFFLKIFKHQFFLVLKSIPYSDLGPFLNPKGPGIKIVIGLVPSFKSTL